MAAVAVVGMSSCNDILDVNNTTQISDEAVWNNEDAAEGYVMASYQTFGDHANLYNVATRFYDGYSDLMKSTSYDQYEHMYNKAYVLTNIFSKNNAGPFGVWSQAYTRIKRANLLLNDIDRYGVSRYGEEWCEIRRAEVRFCNAINYFFLARVYGGVVLRTHNSGVNGLTDDGAYPQDCNRARLSEEETYDYIISELQWAIERLPDTWVTDKYGQKYVGRATKAVAYGFLSRIALYAHKWDIAVDAADKCKTLGNYSLVDNYAQLFNCEFDNENRREVIYAIYGLQKYKTNLFDQKMRPVGDAAVHSISVISELVPTAELADMYEFSDGTEFNWSTWSRTTNPATGKNYTDPFSGREPRFQATILYDGAKWEGRVINTQVGQDETDPTKRGSDYFVEYENSGSTDGHTCTGYYLRKFLMENNSDFTTENSWNTDIVLRYGEVLLNKAEAYAELGQLQDALDAINEIRARVNLPAKQLSDYPDKDAVMTLLRKERCCELAGEGLRYWDLRRWRMLGEVMDGKAMHGVKVVLRNNGALRYDEVEVDGGAKRQFQDRYYYYSIPADELTNNTLCKDNPGW